MQHSCHKTLVYCLDLDKIYFLSSIKKNHFYASYITTIYTSSNLVFRFGQMYKRQRVEGHTEGREREDERHTDTVTDGIKKIDRQTESWEEIQTERHAEEPTDTETNRQTDRPKFRLACR